MQLIDLKVFNGDQIIREITFQDGINIITSEGSNGNQIGKSTTLRVINFCLGSDGDRIWKDPDSGVTNTKIYDLVTSGLVTFFLNLKINGVNYSIKRKFEQKITPKRTILKRYSWVNGEDYHSTEKFKNKIASLFGYNTEKPTYNTVKNRFIRLNKGTSGNIFKFNNAFTSDDEYTLIYSHIFGFQGHTELTLEYDLKQKVGSLKSRINSLLNGSCELDFHNKLGSINDEISGLESKASSYDITGVQNQAIDDLRKNRATVASLSSRIAGLETKEIYNQRTIKNYKNKITQIDTQTIMAIYNEATSLIPEITTSLKETIDFHNSIFVRKAEYVEKQAEILRSELIALKAQLNKDLEKETKLFKSISNESHLSGFILIEQSIHTKMEERGRISYILDEIASMEDEIRAVNTQIIQLRGTLDLYMSELNINLRSFNIPFKAISKKIFKSFSLEMEVCKLSDHSLKFSIINEDKVSGDGAPRAASMAFDMAMVEYVKASGAKLPEFTLQDYLEPADEDKLFELIQLANNRKIQTVISILNDKIQLLEDDFISENSILTLSSKDKFFKIY
ncbi:hypothetical protein PE36_07327 [Moritella sp. PE36]|uniref:DUF2326 domain-containing protein n=1 Tax=Moritella sp. PE36 TaxID=58051 RepID=UPI00015689C1|nr:DUF2326 domain-containing protein [Moritella sp. PE36]EDM69280.1 hypothetical protein PE36_07327 [Moritella sp. PE36]